MILDMPDPDHPDIRGLHLFSGMAEKWFLTLMRGSYVQNFPLQVELITEDDISDFLFVVLSGAVEISTAWNGRERCYQTNENSHQIASAA